MLQHSPLTTMPYESVIELLKLEANAIHKAANQLEVAQLDKALAILSNCGGKVVLSGVGKSGIVAQKIAATLNSIGIISIFLHPCDALHGDLGVVTVDDVAVLLSNSGETQELLEMLPHLKHRKVPIISIVGNLNSTLAIQADVVLDASVDREACPLNLAPTTSTTVAIAIGDALAMTLSQMRGLTPEDFAVNHPAGRLGKRLTLKVEDLMHAGANNPAIAPDATLVEVLSAMTSGGLGAVSILDDKEHLLGIITDGDLRRWLQRVKPSELEGLNAKTMMTQNPISVTTNLLAYEALQLMENRPSQISVLPVVDSENRCIGVIRLHDILRSGL